MRYNLTQIVVGTDYAISEECLGYGTFSGNIIRATAVAPITENKFGSERIISFKFRRSDNNKVVRRSRRGIEDLWESVAAKQEQQAQEIAIMQARIKPVNEAFAVLQDGFRELGMGITAYNHGYQWRGDESPEIAIGDVSYEVAFQLLEIIKGLKLKDLPPMFPPVVEKKVY
jgi:hypothetical protein